MRLRLRFLILIALGLLAALLGAGALFVANASRWLAEPDPVASADAIVILAGSFRRPIYAAELHKQGVAPQVYVSVPARDPVVAILDPLGVRLTPIEETYEQILRAMGVPAASIRRLGNGSLSTFQEAREARKVFTASGTRLVLVTSPFHVRRARMVFEEVFAGTGVGIAVFSAPQEPFPVAWWTSQDAAREVLLEWAKITFYRFGGRFEAKAGT